MSVRPPNGLLRRQTDVAGFTLRQYYGEVVSAKVQTRETTRQLSELDRDLLRERVLTAYSHMESGSIEALLGMFTPDIVCFPKTSWSFAKFPHQIVGKDALRDVLSHRHINYIISKSVIHRMLIDADEAVVYRSRAIRERGGSLSHSFDCVDFFRFRDGLISEFSELPDGSGYEAVVNYPQ